MLHSGSKFYLVGILFDTYFEFLNSSSNKIKKKAEKKSNKIVDINVLYIDSYCFFFLRTWNIIQT